MTIVDVCIVLLTIACLVLIIYIVRVLQTMRQSMEHINNLIIVLKPTLEKGGDESLKLLEQGNELMISINHHSNAFKPLTTSISNLGDALQEKTHGLKEANCLTEASQKSRKEHIETLIELLALSIITWQQIKKRS